MLQIRDTGADCHCDLLPQKINLFPFVIVIWHLFLIFVILHHPFIAPLVMFNSCSVASLSPTNQQLFSREKFLTVKVFGCEPTEPGLGRLGWLGTKNFYFPTCLIWSIAPSKPSEPPVVPPTTHACTHEPSLCLLVAAPLVLVRFMTKYVFFLR